MAKQIKITDAKGKEYTLEYNRRSIQEMESEGFVLSEMENKMFTMTNMLIYGAFKMHHKGLSENKIDEIYKTISNKNEFLTMLGEMFREPVETLMEEPDPETSKKVSWAKNW